MRAAEEASGRELRSRLAEIIKNIINEICEMRHSLIFLRKFPHSPLNYDYLKMVDVVFVNTRRRPVILWLLLLLSPHCYPPIHTMNPTVEPASAPEAEVSKNPIESVEVSLNGMTISFDVAQGGTGPSFFCLGVRKSGSTMLHKIVNFLAARNEINVVNLADKFFRNGFTFGDWSKIDLDPLLAPANLYSGFRALPKNIAASEAYAEGLKVFMFRDPRDALVSQFFSDAFSHRLPSKTEGGGEGRELFLKKREEARNADIDEWVLGKAESLGKTLLSYQELLTDPKCLGLRYESYVFQKRRMIHKVLQHFGWKLTPGAMDRILSEIDIVPESEDKKRFVRKAVPGDHLDKLKPETIQELNEQLSDVMAMLDYY